MACCVAGEDGYLKLEAPFVFIDSDEALVAFLENIGEAKVCALDAEWPPVEKDRGEAKKKKNRKKDLSPAATVAQLAVWDAKTNESHVLVVDLLEVSGPGISQLISQLFLPSDIVKLGYGLWQDVKAIAKAAAQRKRAVEGEDEHELDDDDEGEGGEETKRYRDEPGIISKLRKLSSNSPEWVDLRKYHAVINPRGSALGLQDFTSVLLGCPMKKELQCSPWGERPLQRDQLEYAALDAACLLDMFEKTVQRLIYKTHLSGDGQRSNDLGALEKAVKLEELLRERYQNRKGRKGQKSSSTKNNGGSSALASAFLNLQDWFDGSQERKFICDESLKGLAKQIRSCGFFCEFVTITDEFHELYDKWVAKKPQQEGEESKEDRNKEARQKKSYLRELLIKKIYEKSVAEGSVILTADKLLAQRFDRVYLVRSHGKGDQLKEVLEVFQLEILERNLFTRCITCNGDFVLLLKDRETDAEKKELLSEELPEKLLGKLLGKGDKSDMSREDLLSYLRKELPERLLVKHKEFWICTSCKQVYWKGCRYKTALTNFKNSLLDLHVKLEHTE